VRREYQFPKEIQTSLVKLVRRNQEFQASLVIFNGYCNPVSLHWVRNKTEAFVKYIRTGFDHDSLHFPLERYYLQDVISRRITLNWKKKIYPTLLSLLCSRRKSQSNSDIISSASLHVRWPETRFNPLCSFGRSRFKANIQIFTIVALLLGLKAFFPRKGGTTTISCYK